MREIVKIHKTKNRVLLAYEIKFKKINTNVSSPSNVSTVMTK
jgi:hypothetical protein